MEAVPVTIDGGCLKVHSEFQPGTGATSIINPTFDLSLTDTATDGAATSQATYSLSNNANVAFFDIVFNEQSFGVGGHHAISEGSIQLSITGNVTYSVSGG